MTDSVLELRPSAPLVDAVWADLLLAEHSADVLVGSGVGNSREDDLRAVVRDDRRSCVKSVHGADLGHVLEHGDELDALAGARRCECRQFADWGDVGALVEDQ